MVVSCFGPAEKAKRRRRRKNILSRSVDLSPGGKSKSVKRHNIVTAKQPRKGDHASDINVQV